MNAKLDFAASPAARHAERRYRFSVYVTAATRVPFRILLSDGGETNVLQPR